MCNLTQAQDILENDLEEIEKRKQQEQDHILAEIAKVRPLAHLLKGLQ
jgi:hypothetical protein